MHFCSSPIRLHFAALLLAALLLALGRLAAQTPCERCWQLYDSTNAPFSGGLVWSMAMDSSGGVWVGENNALLHRFNGRRWTTFDMKKLGLPGYPIQGLAIDRTGVFWMTCKGSLVRWDGAGRAETIALDTAEVYAIAVAVGPDATVWVGTHYQGLYSYRAGLVQHRWGGWNRNGSGEGMEMWNVSDIAFDQHNNLWMGTRRGVWMYDGKSFVQYDTSNSSIRHPVIYNLAFARDGAMWSTGFPPLNLCRHRGEQWEEFPSIGEWMERVPRNQPVPSYYQAWTVVALPAGGVLVGSQAMNGVSIWQNGLWWRVGVPTTLKGVTGLAPTLVDRSGRVWMRSTGTLGVVCYDIKRDHPRADSVLPAATVWPARVELVKTTIRSGQSATQSPSWYPRHSEQWDNSDRFEGGLTAPAP